MPSTSRPEAVSSTRPRAAHPPRLRDVRDRRAHAPATAFMRTGEAQRSRAGRPLRRVRPPLRAQPDHPRPGRASGLAVGGEPGRDLLDHRGAWPPWLVKDPRPDLGGDARLRRGCELALRGGAGAGGRADGGTVGPAGSARLRPAAGGARRAHRRPRRPAADSPDACPGGRLQPGPGLLNNPAGAIRASAAVERAAGRPLPKPRRQRR